MILNPEIEFKTGSLDASDISKKISQILDSVKEQGLDSREFSFEMDVGSNGSQFTQKFSSVFNSMNEQGLKAK
jgi:hypothetical protein